MAAGAYLLLVSFLLEFIGRKIQTDKGVLPEIRETYGYGWVFMNFIMEFLFFVVIPTVGYSFLYVVLPFEGVRPAMAATLFALVLGGAPLIMGMSVRLKLPMLFFVYMLFSYFIKLAGSLIIIGYLYML